MKPEIEAEPWSRLCGPASDHGPEGGGLEAGRLGDDPASENPSPAPAAQPQALGINTALIDQVVNARHEVVVLASAHIAHQRAQELVAIAVAPANVRPEGRESQARENVEVGPEPVGEVARRATVDVEYEGGI